MKVVKSIVERAKAPTPKFFKVLRTVGLVLAGISGSLIAAPVVLPAAVATVAGYLAVAGGVISAVSQLTVGPSSFDGAQDNGSEINEEPQQVENKNTG